jgi:hypothetical protein
MNRTQKAGMLAAGIIDPEGCGLVSIPSAVSSSPANHSVFPPLLHSKELISTGLQIFPLSLAKGWANHSPFLQVTLSLRCRLLQNAVRNGGALLGEQDASLLPLVDECTEEVQFLCSTSARAQTHLLCGLGVALCSHGAPRTCAGQQTICCVFL